MKILGFAFQAYQIVLGLLAIVAVTYIVTMIKDTISKKRHHHNHQHH